MYVCTKCHLPHSPKKEENMRYCDECGGYSVNIDDMYIAPVIELWLKGYQTISCCSGHSIQPFSSPAIMFEKGTVLPNIPEGFELDKDTRIIIRYWFYAKEEDRTKIYKTDYQRMNQALN